MTVDDVEAADLFCLRCEFLAATASHYTFVACGRALFGVFDGVEDVAFNGHFRLPFQEGTFSADFGAVEIEMDGVTFSLCSEG